MKRSDSPAVFIIIRLVSLERSTTKMAPKPIVSCDKIGAFNWGGSGAMFFQDSLTSQQQIVEYGDHL